MSRTIIIVIIAEQELSYNSQNDSKNRINARITIKIAEEVAWRCSVKNLFSKISSSRVTCKKLQGLQDIRPQVFSSAFYKNFKSTCFIENLRLTASETKFRLSTTPNCLPNDSSNNAAQNKQ